MCSDVNTLATFRYALNDPVVIRLPGPAGFAAAEMKDVLDAGSGVIASTSPEHKHKHTRTGTGTGTGTGRSLGPMN